MKKLTVLHINKFHYFRAGAETAYLNTSYLLERHGHKSIYFSMHHPENIRVKEDDFFMPFFMPQIELTATHLNIKQKMRASGRILYSLKAKELLSELNNKYRVDVAHVHNIYHHISPSILHELKKRKIPVVMTLHDYKVVCASYSMRVGERICEDCSYGKYYNIIKNRCVKDSLPKSVLSTLEMYFHHKFLDIYNSVNLFISPSLFLKSKVEEMGFKKKIICLPNFFDVSGFNYYGSDPDHKEITEEPSIAFFGRISEEKGIRTLIKSAKMLNDDDKSGKIVIKIIGDGPIKNELQEKVNAEKINNVRFIGHMEPSILFEEIKKCMAVVLPSEWYENNPFSIIEAFALGVPVIGAKIGGIPELVKDNNTGLTFESGNAYDLYLKIKYAIDNRDKMVEMGRNARKYIEDNLSAEKYYERLIEIYRQVITENNCSTFS